MSEDVFDLARSRPGPRDRRLAEMLRVDHAGEFGAVQIYRGQRAVFDRVVARARTAGLLKEMEDGEAEHLETFERLLAERGVRPTLLAPVWRAAGYGLGAATALMGEKAAMACTAAVEDVIEKHYAEQAEELAASEPALAEIVRKFRDDELGHKHLAEDEGGAAGLGLLSDAIRLGCRAAIKLAEKI